MAKINHFLLEYRESISKVSGKLKTEEFPLPVLRRFIQLFSDIDDSRNYSRPMDIIWNKLKKLTGRSSEDVIT